MHIDHVVILVDNLADAVDGYTQLGFTVIPGGQHPAWGSRNALIGLADGTYLELIAFDARSPEASRMPKEILAAEVADEDRSPVKYRVQAWRGPSQGIVDFALLPADAQRDITRAAGHGLVIEGPFPGSRTRPDGQKVRWQLGIPATFDVPFLCGDVTERSLRVPTNQAARHENGAVGVHRLLVATADLDDSILRYRALLGTTPHKMTLDLPDTQTAVFDVGPAQIALTSPAGKQSPIAAVLSTRGQGPFALDLHTQDPGRTGPMDATLSHGSRINMVAAE